MPVFGRESGGVYDGGDLGFEWFGLVDLYGDGAHFFNRSVSECFDLSSLLRSEGMGEI